MLPAAQVGETELEEIVKIGQAGENAKALVSVGGSEASARLLSDYEGLEKARMARTPRTAPQGKLIYIRLLFPMFILTICGFVEDTVLSEARNLRNMVIAQTPLLGDENTPLHQGPGGTGFEGATPKHQVAFTPNPLATPRQNDVDGLTTPRGDTRSIVGGTPLRTPMRDNLSINPEGQYSVIGDTPREERMRGSSVRNALRAGFMSLPKPENNFELLVPEDEDNNDNAEEDGEMGGATLLSEEDAAERDARIQRLREERERKALARRTLVVQMGLPRPAHVDVEDLLERLAISQTDSSSSPPPSSSKSKSKAKAKSKSKAKAKPKSKAKSSEDADMDEAIRLVHHELAQLLQHDSIAHPIPGTSHPGNTKSSYLIPQDQDITTARSEIQKELATWLGYPDATEEQVKQGVKAVVDLEQDMDESVSWARKRRNLAFDADKKTWVDPIHLSEESQISGMSVLLNQSREAMSCEAQKASKAEKKLGVMLGGYQARSQVLIKKVVEGFEELQKTKMEFDSFSLLKVNESATGPGRVSALKEEVVKLERREELLQGRYAELDSERRELVARVGMLEERVMEEAEALNEAALAELEQETA